MHFRSSDPENTLTSTVDWAFSPDSTRILYATNKNRFFIESNDGALLELPLIYQPPMCCGLDAPRRDLQWSLDGSKVLVFGKLTLDGYKDWIMLDSTSGEIIWRQDFDDFVNDLGLFNFEGVAVNDAALSPDGEWFFSSYQQAIGAYRFSAITSISTGITTLFSEGWMQTVIWVN
ncbi:MAG: hypothetical protein FVQ83_09370 [Chloroflexi bacterium]|nr:hypothetical protein [Chloroflexota bacterium]